MAAIAAPAAEAHDPKLASHFVNQYQLLIQKLAQEKASTILLPEKALTINPANQPQVMNQLSALALDNHVTLIVGVNEFKESKLASLGLPPPVFFRLSIFTKLNLFMKVFSHSISNNYLQDAYGHRGTDFIKTKPCRSFHIGWSDLPKNTKSLALIFIDYEAIPVCGFPWIHWTMANIDPNLGELPENFSVQNKSTHHLKPSKFIEGVTSWNSKLLPPEWFLEKEDATGYGGAAPPDRTHLYTVDLFSLDTDLNLKRGFFMNELLEKMEGHILGQAKLQMFYKSKSE